MAEMDSLSFKVEYDIGNSKKKIDGLKTSLSGLSKVLKEFQGLNGVSKQFKGLAGASSSVSKAARAFSKLGNVKVSKTIGDNLRNITSALDGIDKTKIENANGLADALLRFSQVKIPSLTKTGAEKTSGETQGQEVGDEQPNESADLGNLTRAQQAFKSIGVDANRVKQALGDVARGASKAVGAIAKFGANGIRSVFNNLKNDVKGVTTKFGELARAIGRIALYRALRSIIKSITEGFSEGITNVYYYSDAIQGRLASSLDSIAASTSYLKNSLGAMASPIINALAPAIDYLIDKFVALLNIINQVFARLSGAAMWTKAIKQTKKWGDEATGSAGSAKKAADEYKRTILGFDEINKLNDTKDSSGSSGSGSGTDYSSMFEEVPVDSKITNFVDQLKDAISKGDWKSAGTMLGDKVNEMVESALGSGKATEYGSAIGYWANGFMQTLYYSLDTINFGQIAKYGANLVSGIINGIDWTYAGRLMVKKFTILVDMAIGGIRGMDWHGVGKALGDFVIGALNEMANFFRKYDWKEVGNDVYNLLTGAFQGVSWTGVFTALVDATTSVFKGIWDFTNSIAKNWVNDQVNFYSYLGNNAKTIFGKMKDWIVEKWNNIKSSTESIWSGISSEVSAEITSAKNTVSSVVSAISGNVSNAWNNIRGVTTSVWNGIKNAMVSPIETAKNTIKGIVDTIKGFFNNFHVSLPHIKLPHFSIQPYGWTVSDLLKGTIPKLGIQWYAKGGIMDGSTIFGMNGNNLMVGGESGKEAVLPLESNTQWMDKVADKVVAKSTDGTDYQTLIEQNRTLISLMRRQNELTQEVASKDTNVSISTSDITSGMQRKSRRDGKPVTVGR